MAALLDAYAEAFALPLPSWLQAALVRPLAALGCMRGRRFAEPEEPSP